MSGECDKVDELKLLKALQTISRILDNVKYECCARAYTLDQDEMGWIFYCRDEADLAIKAYKDKNVR